VLPCAVDTVHFAPDPAARERLRRELGLAGTVLVYAGKSGGWYLTDAMLDFAAVAREVLGEVSLLVLTTEPPEGFARAAAARGLALSVRRAARDEMPAFLSAGDAGLSFVLSAPSKAACSPVKNGEYLACGLPIVTTPGIGDYSDLVSEERVGVVVGAMETEAYRRGAETLGELLADPRLRSRCRAVAKRRVGLDEVVVPRYVAIYDALLGPRGARG
jgi:glycosyltransferase involved in cell wall biosynthesis